MTITFCHDVLIHLRTAKVYKLETPNEFGHNYAVSMFSHVNASNGPTMEVFTFFLHESIGLRNFDILKYSEKISESRSHKAVRFGKGAYENVDVYQTAVEMVLAAAKGEELPEEVIQAIQQGVIL